MRKKRRKARGFETQKMGGFFWKMGITISCEIWYCRGGTIKTLTIRAYDAVIETPIYSHKNVYDFKWGLLYFICTKGV